MPLTFAQPPSDASSALIQGLQELQAAQGTTTIGGVSVQALAKDFQAMTAFSVYDLGLDELVQGAPLEDARLTAWRFLLVHQGQVKLTADVTTSAGGASEFHSITTGYAAGTEAGFDTIDNLPMVQQDDFEVRALRVPALYVLALWLHGDGNAGDHFVVLPPAFAPFQELQVTPQSDFMPLLHQEAIQKQQQEQQISPISPP